MEAHLRALAAQVNGNQFDISVLYTPLLATALKRIPEIGYYITFWTDIKHTLML